ncbi:DoxX family protein [Burkholderia sp. FERM BP-3421]|uniref:DoxX family protein n=1 Tax=Burkholderia sp. FERM BP-3421 TaxID=1494466 RepID=UPI002362501B|nr:DoxX family protein [Burkholderia sp. FERM BP-3421]WDD94067.1 DoxX family protein [Burkholderia sp. FERM BP-3421]
MQYLALDRYRDGGLLVARVMMVLLFVLFGWQKLVGFHDAVAYMASTGAPLPALAAVIAVVMELVVGLLLAAGFYTRPLALLLALYTLGTAAIGHRYWSMTGLAQYDNMIHFYKNVAIAGGLLLLALTGPGKYSLDRR